MRNLGIRLFCFLACFLSVTVNAANLAQCKQHQCLAVVDAGSTGSRLHIYSYDLDETKTAININELWSKKVKPGLATLEANQTSINTYLSSLFSNVPEDNLSVYFYSTAGMRLLPQPKQKQIYNLIQSWFSSQSRWQLLSAKTITGNDEGLYGWLAVNYKLGTLKSNNTSIGVMDMGGASVQVVLPVKNMEGNTDVKQFELYGRPIQLFIHSFLGLGQTEVTHQFLDTDSCFSEEYVLPKGTNAKGDAYACAREVSNLMNAVHRVNHIVQPVIEANPVTNWFVMGGMAELAQTKPFQFSNYQYTNQALIEQANSQVCQQSWSNLNQKYPNNEYLYGYCLFPAYYYALMVDGYGLQPQQTVNYIPSNQGNDWTLGVVLHRLG